MTARTATSNQIGACPSAAQLGLGRNQPPQTSRAVPGAARLRSSQQTRKSGQQSLHQRINTRSSQLNGSAAEPTALPPQVDISGNQAALFTKQPDRMRVQQQKYAYDNYNQGSKALALKQLLNRRNVLSMKDQIENQKDLQKYLKNAKKLEVFLDHPQREELGGNLEQVNRDDVVQILKWRGSTSMVSPFGGLMGHIRQSMPNTAREVMDPTGLKVEQGVEEVLIESKAARPSDIISHPRFFTKMRLSESSDVRSKYIQNNSPSSLSHIKQQSNNPLASSVPKYHPLYNISNLAKISEKKVNFSPQQRSHKSSRKSHISYANLSQTAGTSKNFILQSKVGGTQMLNHDYDSYFSCSQKVLGVVKKPRQKSSYNVARRGLQNEENQKATSHYATQAQQPRVATHLLSSLKGDCVFSEEVTLSQGVLKRPPKNGELRYGQDCESDQDQPRHQPLVPNQLRVPINVPVVKALQRNHFDKAVNSDATGHQQSDATDLDASRRLINQMENNSASDTIIPSPQLSPRGNTDLDNKSPLETELSQPTIEQIQIGQQPTGIDTKSIPSILRKNAQPQMKGSSPDVKDNHASDDGQKAKTVDFQATFGDRLLEQLQQQNDDKLDDGAALTSYEDAQMLQRILGIEKAVRENDQQYLNQESLQGLIHNQILMDQEAELMDSLCKYEMLTNVQSQSFKEEKMLLNGIAEIMGQSDRQLKPYSRVRRLRDDKTKKDDYNQKIQRELAQQLHSKIDRFKENLRNKDELKHIIDSGISFKNPKSHKILQELEMNPTNFWELAQIIQKQRRQQMNNEKAHKQNQVPLKQVKMQEESANQFKGWQDHSSNTLKNDLIQRLILENYQQEQQVNEESAEIDHQKASAPSHGAMALLDTIPIIVRSATPRSTQGIVSDQNGGEITITPRNGEDLSYSGVPNAVQHQTDRSNDLPMSNRLEIQDQDRGGQATDREKLAKNSNGPSCRSLNLAVPGSVSHMLRIEEGPNAIQKVKIKDRRESCGSPANKLDNGTKKPKHQNRYDKQPILSIECRGAAYGDATARSMGVRTQTFSNRTIRGSQKLLTSNQSSVDNQECGELESRAIPTQGQITQLSTHNKPKTFRRLKSSKVECATRRKEKNQKSGKTIRAEIKVVKGEQLSEYNRLPYDEIKSSVEQQEETTEDLNEQQIADSEKESVKLHHEVLDQLDFIKVTSEITTQVDKLKNNRRKSALRQSSGKAGGALKSSINFLSGNKQKNQPQVGDDEDLNIVRQIILSPKNPTVKSIGKISTRNAKIDSGAATSNTNGSNVEANENESKLNLANDKMEENRYQVYQKDQAGIVLSQALFVASFGDACTPAYGFMKGANNDNCNQVGRGVHPQLDDELRAGLGTIDASHAGGLQTIMTNVRNINVQDLTNSGQFNVTAENGTLYERSPVPKTLNTKSISKSQASLASNQRADRALEKPETLEFKNREAIREENGLLNHVKRQTNRDLPKDVDDVEDRLNASQERLFGPSTQLRHMQNGILLPPRTRRSRILSGKISSGISSSRTRLISAKQKFNGSSSVKSLKDQNSSSKTPQIPQNMQNNMYLYKKNSSWKQSQNPSASTSVMHIQINNPQINLKVNQKQLINNDLADAMDKREKANGDKMRKSATKKSNSKDSCSQQRSNSNLGLKLQGQHIAFPKHANAKQPCAVNSQNSRISNSQTVTLDPLEQSCLTSPGPNAYNLYSPRLNQIAPDHQQAHLQQQGLIRLDHCENTIMELTKEQTIDGELSALLTPQHKGERSSKFFISSKIIQSTDKRKNALNETLQNLSNSDIRDQEIAVKGVQKCLVKPAHDKQNKLQNVNFKNMRLSPQQKPQQARQIGINAGGLKAINSSYLTTSPDLNLTNYEAIMNNTIVNQNQSMPREDPAIDFRTELNPQVLYMAIPSSNQQIVIQTTPRDEDEVNNEPQPKQKCAGVMTTITTNQLKQSSHEFNLPSVKSNQRLFSNTQWNFQRAQHVGNNQSNNHKQNDKKGIGISRKFHPRGGIQKGITLCTERTTKASFCSPNSLTIHGAVGPENLLTSGTRIEGPIKSPQTQRRQNDATRGTLEMERNVRIPHLKEESHHSKPLNEGMTSKSNSGMKSSVDAIGRRLTTSRGCSRDHSNSKPKMKPIGSLDNNNNPDPNLSKLHQNATSVSHKTFETVLVFGTGTNRNLRTAQSGSSPCPIGPSVQDQHKPSQLDSATASQSQAILFGLNRLNSDMQNILDPGKYQMMPQITPESDSNLKSHEKPDTDFKFISP